MYEYDEKMGSLDSKYAERFAKPCGRGIEALPIDHYCKQYLNLVNTYNHLYALHKERERELEEMKRQISQMEEMIKILLQKNQVLSRLVNRDVPFDKIVEEALQLWDGRSTHSSAAPASRQLNASSSSNTFQQPIMLPPTVQKAQAAQKPIAEPPRPKVTMPAPQEKPAVQLNGALPSESAASLNPFREPILVTTAVQIVTVEKTSSAFLAESPCPMPAPQEKPAVQLNGTLPSKSLSISKKTSSTFLAEPPCSMDTMPASQDKPAVQLNETLLSESSSLPNPFREPILITPAVQIVTVEKTSSAFLAESPRPMVTMPTSQEKPAVQMNGSSGTLPSESTFFREPTLIPRTDQKTQQVPKPNVTESGPLKRPAPSKIEDVSTFKAMKVETPMVKPAEDLKSPSTSAARVSLEPKPVVDQINNGIQQLQIEVPEEKNDHVFVPQLFPIEEVLLESEQIPILKMEQSDDQVLPLRTLPNPKASLPILMEPSNDQVEDQVQSPQPPSLSRASSIEILPNPVSIMNGRPVETFNEARQWYWAWPERNRKIENVEMMAFLFNPFDRSRIVPQRVRKPIRNFTLFCFWMALQQSKTDDQKKKKKRIDPSHRTLNSLWREVPKAEQLVWKERCKELQNLQNQQIAAGLVIPVNLNELKQTAEVIVIKKEIDDVVKEPEDS